MAIDPTARVAEGARIGEGVEIGPYCLVGPQVEIGRGVRLLAHVNVTGATTIGEGAVVYPFASLGTPPQSVHYRGGATRLIIGARCELRESVTMNTGTEEGGGVTRVGERCFFMVGSHVGHDCAVGNDVTLANNVVLGGHVSIGDHTFLGGHVAIHQFVRIGEGVDDGRHVGRARRHHPVRIRLRPDRSAGRAQHGRIAPARRDAGAKCISCGAPIAACFSSKDAWSSASRRSRGNSPAIRWSEKIIAFIRAGGRRPLMRPRAKHSADERGGDAG